ncbi:replication-relaxation family protein [Antrihabitans sp. YC2-6]|nr:replication-relaxation family protein [Antrihabitans sp. YC2-6]
MSLFDRDVAMLRDVGRFRLLRTSQVNFLHFHDVSDTPRKRSLIRCVGANMLRVIETPAPGGSRGGNAENYYQLTREGHKAYGVGEYRLIKAVYPERHKVQVAEVYISAIQAFRDGWLEEASDTTTDPYSAEQIGGVEIDPDLYLDVRVPEFRHRWRYWVEVDLATENIGKIKAKLQRYAYVHQYIKEQQAEAERSGIPNKWSTYRVRRVLWLVEDDKRLRQLKKWIIDAEVPANLFEVHLLSSFPQVLNR